MKEKAIKIESIGKKYTIGKQKDDNLRGAITNVFKNSENSNRPSTELKICWFEPAVKIPPVWKVLIVNCVPGSPIDCPAIIPTASPKSTKFSFAKFQP